MPTLMIEKNPDSAQSDYGVVLVHFGLTRPLRKHLKQFSTSSRDNAKLFQAQMVNYIPDIYAVENRCHILVTFPSHLKKEYVLIA